MSSFTDLFIRRPVLASVVSLLILLVGMAALFKLPVRQFPELTSTTITITTVYPGADAELVKGFITTPLQQAVASAEGIDTLSSSSSQNASVITINLALNANADRAMTDVLAKINQVKSVLPKEANDPVVVKKTGDGIALLYMSFSSDVLTAPQITDYLTRVVQPKLQTLDGVAEAQILGQQIFAMRIWLDPQKMAALHVTPTDVRNALLANNFISAAGQLKGDFTQTDITVKTSLASVKAFEDLVVRVQGDILIRLSQIAKIELGAKIVDSSSVFDGLKAVFIGIYATPSANPLSVISGVKAEMPEIIRNLPPAVRGAIAYDATQFIRASIYEVAKTLGEAILIVIVVIFLFLGNLRSTLVPVVTIPLSLIGVMVVLLFLGYSINLLTLLALVLAIGLVVDDAIVVVENIHRHIEEGFPPFEASLMGAREIATPVIAMTITLAAVYAPIGFVSGLTGALFREFAFTLAGAVVVSGVIALTLSPMMCSFLLKKDQESGRFAKFLDHLFERFQNIYKRLLIRSLRAPSVTLVILTGTIFASGILYLSTQRELAPEEDQGILFVLSKAPTYANLDYLEHYTDQLGLVFSKVAEKAHYFAINGSGNVQTAFAGILLKPWEERSRTHKQILENIQPKLNSVSGLSVLSFPPSPLPGTGGGPPVQFVITTTEDFPKLASLVDEMQKKAMKSGYFIFSDIDLRFNTPQLVVNIDRDKANRLGISMQDIGSSLATLLGGNYVNRFDLKGRGYEVIPQVPRAYRFSDDDILVYQVRTASGQLVPLSSVVSFSRSVQPNALTTFQQLNSATFSGVPFPGRTVGDAVSFLREAAKEILPRGVGYDFQGVSRQFVKEGNTLAITFFFALIVIFLVLSAQFESFRDPLIILIALPTSIFGALLPLNFGLGSINIYTQIGLVTLIGLISKHGILMVEFANNLQRTRGMNKKEAIVEAASVRLRPILMTTAAMVVGMFPLLLAQGAGAQSRFAIGVVIAFGMMIGTLFTLFVTPAVYSYIAGSYAAGASR